MPAREDRQHGDAAAPTIAQFADAVQANDFNHVRAMLALRPELVGLDRSENDEHRALHYAVLQRNVPMTKLLMEAGADARKGIFPHRDATSALVLARDRGYHDIVTVIEEEERHRREEMSCPNARVSPVQDQISNAILRGDPATAIALLEADLSLVQACDRDGASPLHIAAAQNDLKLLTWLLQHRANPRKPDGRGLTPLDRAALGAHPSNQRAQRYPAVAEVVLGHGAELTIRGAVALGSHDRVRELITARPEVLQEIDASGGLLTLAVNHGQVQMAEMLLDLGADVDERILLKELEEPVESWGMPLWHAALAGDLRMTKLLLDHGADPNANVYASGWPLQKAWYHEDESVKKLLLERGATPKPYMLAETHDLRAAEKLLAAEPTEDIVRELVWAAADHGCPEMVAMALAHLRWQPQDPRWHWVLIQPVRGASANPAENSGHFASLVTLLEHGINPNITRFGQTALHFTAARQSDLTGNDRARFASLLLDYGASTDLRDELLQSTPLGWSCRWGRQEMVELLIHRGARVQEETAEPWATPLAWAEKMGHSEIATLLLRELSPGGNA